MLQNKTPFKINWSNRQVILNSYKYMYTSKWWILWNISVPGTCPKTAEYGLRKMQLLVLHTMSYGKHETNYLFVIFDHITIAERHWLHLPKCMCTVVQLTEQYESVSFSNEKTTPAMRPRSIPSSRVAMNTTIPQSMPDVGGNNIKI